MYHDQGLIALKTLEFDRAVNVTLGLPFVRTSPDHGTAYDIAGCGAANAASMIAAMEYAWRAVSGRNGAASSRRGGAAAAQSCGAKPERRKSRRKVWQRWRIGNGGSNSHQGRARAQSQEYRPRDSARSPRRHHRAFGLGQILARLRHHLRRGPAPLRRVTFGLRAPVPGADGEAGRRFDRGTFAGDLDRTEDHLAQPALDGRPPSPKFTTTCACCSRASATRFATTAGAKSRSRAFSKSSIASWPGPTARASTCSRRSCAIARANIEKELSDLRRAGFVRVKIDGKLRRIGRGNRAQQESCAIPLK